MNTHEFIFFWLTCQLNFALHLDVKFNKCCGSDNFSRIMQASGINYEPESKLVLRKTFSCTLSCIHKQKSSNTNICNSMRIIWCDEVNCPCGLLKRFIPHLSLQIKRRSYTYRIQRLCHKFSWLLTILSTLKDLVQNVLSVENLK